MLEDVNQRLKTEITREVALAKSKWLHRDIIIPRGKFKDRRGKVTDIDYDPFVGMMINWKPYSKNRLNCYYAHEDPKLIHHDDECRKYHPFAKLEELRLARED